jgi:hypothetical protein
MLSSRFIRVLYMILAISFSQVAFGLTVNGDLEGNPSTDTTYSGDNGILSSSGGTVWNSIPNAIDTLGLLDEFGNSTGIGVVWTTFGSYNVLTGATNALQDSGTINHFDIVGLNQNLKYQLAIYADSYSGGSVTDDTGTFGGLWADLPTFTMPGASGHDYTVYTDLIPTLLYGNTYGIRLDDFDGSVLGFQIKTVPIPAAFWLLGSGLLGLFGLNRRNKTAS